MARVSVVLPVKDGGHLLRSAIGSILHQTYRDIELIVVDDASQTPVTDEISDIQDPRVSVIRSDSTLGVAGACRLGVERATGELIARQDHDDLSHPNRIARQVSFLEDHSEIGLLGTWARIRSDEGLPGSGGYHKHPSDDASIRIHLLWNNSFVHSTVMMNHEAYERGGGYMSPPDGRTPEDYDLWSRLSGICLLANLPEVLLVYRQRRGGESERKRREIDAGVVEIAATNILHAAGSDGARTAAMRLARRLNGYPLSALGSPVQDAALLHRALSGIPGNHAKSASKAKIAIWRRFAAGSARGIVRRSEASGNAQAVSQPSAGT